MVRAPPKEAGKVKAKCVRIFKYGLKAADFIFAMEI